MYIINSDGDKFIEKDWKLSDWANSWKNKENG